MSHKGGDLFDAGDYFHAKAQRCGEYKDLLFVNHSSIVAQAMNVMRRNDAAMKTNAGIKKKLKS